MDFVKIITWLDWVTIIFSFITMFGVFWGLYQRQRDKDKIEIFILKNGKKFLLPTYLMRKNCTRAEVFGILGALDLKSKFEIKYTSNEKFIKNIFDIQTGKEKELVIKLADDDVFNYELKE